MTEPSLALQTAVRARLVNTPAVTALVEPAAIREGDTRPDLFPSVIFANSQVVVSGHYKNYRNVTAFLDLHVWAEGDGIAPAKTIGGEVWNAIGRELEVPGFDLHDGVHVERSWYGTDSGKGHGVITVRAHMGCFL